MDLLLKICFDFAEEWKVRFNTSKSISFSLNRHEGVFFEVDRCRIPEPDHGFIYSGMPIGNYDFVVEHLRVKFRKVMKAFYSLR